MSFICHIHNNAEYNEEWMGSSWGFGALLKGLTSVVDFLPEPGFKPTTLGYLRFQVQHSIH